MDRRRRNVREVALELLLVAELAEAAVVVGGSGTGRGVVVPGHGAAVGLVGGRELCGVECGLWLAGGRRSGDRRAPAGMLRWSWRQKGQ
jgi:hypothetical protein